MYPILLQWNDFSLSSWLVFVLIGGWTAYFSFQHEMQDLPISKRQIQFFWLSVAISWFVGAHIGYFLTIEKASSGYVLYGGMISSIIYSIAFWFFSGWWKKFYLNQLADRALPGLAWALAFGRIGCTLYGCCYGSPSGNWPGYFLNQDHWNLEERPFPQELAGIKLHPATFYEAIGIFLILFFVSRMKKKPALFPPGVRGLSIPLFYSILRFFLEFIRLDPRGIPQYGLYPSQWIALAVVPVCIGIILYEYYIVRYDMDLTKIKIKTARPAPLTTSKK